jgi:phosphoglycolate phosphatase
MWREGRVRTVLFDLDGTLIDSRADLATAVNLTRRDFGLEPRPMETILAAVGEGVRRLIEQAIPEYPEHWEEMVARQREHYGAHLLDQTCLYPGVAETVRTLCERGWRLGVVTNKPAPFIRPILEGLGVAEAFSAVVGGGDCPHLKPDPAPLRLAAARMGSALQPTDWMVGDHFTDLAAGRNAGIRRAFCRFGFGEAREETFDLALDRMEELLDALG